MKTKIIKIDFANPEKKLVKEILDFFLAGKIVVFPTDTVYGIGCLANNYLSVKKIFTMKKRDGLKVMPLLVGSKAMARRIAQVDNFSNKIINKYWPGGLTLILPRQRITIAEHKKIIVDQAIFSSLDDFGKKARKDLGLRMPNDELLLNIIVKLNRPIIGTSANLSGQKECYSLKDLQKQLNQNNILPDLIIVGKKITRKNKPSTVAKIEGNRINILRQGAIKIKPC